MSSYELYHHGIKGQKWGVRRTDRQLGHEPPKKKKLSEMSDDELNKNINRLRRQKEYKELTRKGPKINIATALAAVASTATLMTNLTKISNMYPKVKDAAKAVTQAAVNVLDTPITDVLLKG